MVFDFHSEGCHRAGQAPSHGFCSIMPAPCSFLKVHGSHPCRISEDARLFLCGCFIAPNVFLFIACFRCNKIKIKGPIKENALSWHLPSLWMLPELLLPERCLLPSTTCTVTSPKTLPLVANIIFLGLLSQRSSPAV